MLYTLLFILREYHNNITIVHVFLRYIEPTSSDNEHHTFLSSPPLYAFVSLLLLDARDLVLIELPPAFVLDYLYLQYPFLEPVGAPRVVDDIA